MILHCFNPFALICKQTYEVEDFYRVEYEPDQIHNWTSLNLFNQMVSINHHLNLDWMEGLIATKADMEPRFEQSHGATETNTD